MQIIYNKEHGNFMLAGSKELPRGTVRSFSNSSPLKSTTDVGTVELLPLMNEFKD